MSSKTQYLIKQGLLKSPPKFLETGVQYEVVMGSIAYGVAEDHSDMDVYGFAIPPRDWVFPHLLPRQQQMIHSLPEKRILPIFYSS